MKSRLLLERGEEDDYDANARARKALLEVIGALGSRAISYLEELVSKGDFDGDVYAACLRIFRGSDPFVDTASSYLERAKAWDAFVHAEDEILDETPSPSFLRISQDDEAFERYERNVIFCQQVKDLIGHGIDSIAPTARIATMLHAYKEAKMVGTPTEASSSQALRIGRRLSAQEARYEKHDVPLPTIGIELEVPDRFLTAEHLEILRSLGVPCYRDCDNLNEVNPHFSYSPWVQACILRDLVELNFVPSVFSAHGKRSTPKDLTLPLHINFGSPSELWELAENEEGVHAELSLISDVLVFGFTSSKRVLDRGYGEAYYYKSDAEPSVKTEKGSGRLFRLELRAAEFSGPSTYRLLMEAQSLVGMFFAHCKHKTSQELSGYESALAELWPDFVLEVERFRDGFHLHQPNIASSGNKDLAREMENPRLQETARLLIARYARKIQGIVFQNYE